MLKNKYFYNIINTILTKKNMKKKNKNKINNKQNHKTFNSIKS